MFHKKILHIDMEEQAQRICSSLVEMVKHVKRRGLVVGVSGGIDSSTCIALAQRALGKDRVFGILMPERDSSGASIKLGKMVCEHLGVPYEIEDIRPILEGAACYRRRDEAIREVFPEYNETYKQKIVLPPVGERDRLNYYSIVIQAPSGEVKKARLPLKSYLQVVAATNFKQRTRAMLEYYHADRLNYAVVATPNRLEYDQGFFVKGGDGLGDVKPIAHLYKSQVYALARHLGLPPEVTSSTPTTDTYSMPQGQDEFYFALPYEQMDLVLYAYNQHLTPEQVAPVVDLTPEQVQFVYRDIKSKRQTTQYMHLPPILVEEVPDVGTKLKSE